MDTSVQTFVNKFIDEHYSEFLERLATKIQDASTLPLVNYDALRHQAVLMQYVWEGVHQVQAVKPATFLEQASTLMATAVNRANTAIQAAEDINRQISAAEAQRVLTETARANAEDARAAAEILRAAAEEARVQAENTRGTNETDRQTQETARQTQEAARQAAETQRSSWFYTFRATVEEWYSPFRDTAENWYSGVVAAWNAWFDATMQAWTEWFNATKLAWQGILGDWTSWFSATDNAKTALFTNIRDTWDDMSMMFSSTVWNSQTVYLRNKAVKDDQGNWWVSLKSTLEAPNLNHPLPGFDEHGDPVASEWWRLWIDWEHPMARLLAAMQQAIESAADADAKAYRAEQAAIRAESVDIIEHDSRISALESAVGTITDDDLVEINQAISNLQALIGTDVDGTINKFNEMVAFFAGMGESDTLDGKIQELVTMIQSKQPAGDYATNERVDELEGKVDSLESPRMVGTHLTFPSRSTARMVGSHLILAE